MTKRKFTWFLEPLDAGTNDLFRRELPEENIQRDILCADGILRNLWECPGHRVRPFWESREQLGLKFKIFCREGKNGGIKECTKIFKKGSKTALKS